MESPSLESLDRRTFARSHVRTFARAAAWASRAALSRHSYLSHKYADVNKEKQKDAEVMMHSQDADLRIDFIHLVSF
eukprot:COSAG02_NODE_2133_length_9721_cov_11.017044_6_plen_77_part_00